jgi:hypothetical protein
MRITVPVAVIVMGLSCAGTMPGSARFEGVASAPLAAPVKEQARQPAAPATKERVVHLGRNFDVRINETVAIDGESLRITFERVVEDSRCPTNTTCVCAGDAVVRLALLGANAERGTLNLHTLSETAAQGCFQRFRLRLVQLVPVPHDSGGIPAEQYVATLVVA